MIKTKTFSLHPNQYFKIVLSNRLKRSWFIYLVMILGATALLNLENRDKLIHFLIILGYLYPVYTLVYLYFWSRSRDNKTFFTERSIEFDEDKFIIRSTDGGMAEIPYSSIIRVAERKKYYLLYLAKSQFLYVPFDVFLNGEDFEGFIQKVKRI